MSHSLLYSRHFSAACASLGKRAERDLIRTCDLRSNGAGPVPQPRDTQAEARRTREAHAAAAADNQFSR